ncbi:MAG TPA: hypothetical protein DEA50_05300 [Parvularcula sp.]|nr:hypothetical protein [Parvularcula sp.]
MAQTSRPRPPARKRGAGKIATAKSKARRPLSYAGIRTLALSLGLPGVTEAVSWGQPCLKAHGKLWFFWSPSENAPVFKIPFEERDMLVASAPDTFFFTGHDKSHPLALAGPDRIGRPWIRANLFRVWRELAPKRVLKRWDEEQGR